MSKYIFVTGGVVSSLGKGITAASLGCLLKSRGYRVSIQKLDPYINYNPGNMSPFQHGEIFVTEDGAETDLDLGHYERFIDENLTAKNNYTAGKIYWSVIQQEREGEFNGGTVQVIPHVTNEIKDRIMEVAHQHPLDVLIVEVGGTVGDIESLPFLEAIRQMKTDVGRDQVLYIHVTLIPYLPATEELKTKPTQHSVKELRSIGIQPDLIVCRSDQGLSWDTKEKIGLFCDIQPQDVVENLHSPSIYQVPLQLLKENFDRSVIEKLDLNVRPEGTGEVELERWKSVVEENQHLERETVVALVGRYVSLKDAYLSATEALVHAAASLHSRVQIRWISDEELEKGSPAEVFQSVDGVIIPGGMGEAGCGLEAKVKAVNWCRRQGIPYLGINTGMQGAVVELTRQVCGWEGANSAEADKNAPLLTMEEMDARVNQEGEQVEPPCLGRMPCKLQAGTRAYQVYGKGEIYERFRHGYELKSSQVRAALEEEGVVFSGYLQDRDTPCLVELPDHPWFMAVQFHPEFKSRLLEPHPLFCSFIEATLKASAEKR